MSPSIYKNDIVAILQMSKNTDERLDGKIDSRSTDFLQFRFSAK